MPFQNPTHASELPRVARDARFVPAERLRGAAHVVVDGARLPGTALALSHWPDSGTPDALVADTSALIVDRYLRSGASGPELRAVTNNHYDEDGLFGIWLLLERPPDGSPERALALAAAEAGDFGDLDRPLGRAGGHRRDGHGRAGTAPRSRRWGARWRARAGPTRRERSTWPSCPARAGSWPTPSATR